MDRAAIKTLVMYELSDITAEAEQIPLSEQDNFRERLALDSIDFLNLICAVSRRTGVDIPESRYGSVQTLGGMVEFLSAEHA